MRAASFDDPASGPYLLAFKDPSSWAASYKSCESKLIAQCEEGARNGCAIAASNKCKPPFWQSLVGRKLMDLKERERCEDREMEGCLVAAEEKCVGFAKERCTMAFFDARIALGESDVPNEVVRRIVHVALMAVESRWCHLIGLDKFRECELSVTNYRASQFLGSGVQLQT